MNNCNFTVDILVTVTTLVQKSLSCVFFNLLYYRTVDLDNQFLTKAIHIWVILWQLFKIPSCVYMKGKFVINVSFATVLLINHS